MVPMHRLVQSARGLVLAAVLVAPQLASAKIVLKKLSDLGPTDSSLRFGAMYDGPDYQIYRSAMLGKKGLKKLQTTLEEHDLPFPKTIIYMNHNGYTFPFYFALEEYKASLSDEYGHFQFVHPFGAVRTYIDGKNPYDPKLDIDTKRSLGHEARKLFPLRDDGVDGGINNVLNVLKTILNPENQPVLFHCQGGRHRAGMIAMLLRYMEGGFWVDGPKTKRDGISLNPAQYEYFRFNILMFSKNNVAFVEKFVTDPRFLELKEQYGEILRENNVYDLSEIEP